jgi:hypothetical protein
VVWYKWTSDNSYHLYVHSWSVL